MSDDTTNGVDNIEELLYQIDDMKNLLEEDGVDISHIPRIDNKSNIEETKYVHLLLSRKLHIIRVNQQKRELWALVINTIRYIDQTTKEKNSP